MVISSTLSRWASAFSTTVGLLPTLSERSVNKVKWSHRILAPRETASRAQTGQTAQQMDMISAQELQTELESILGQIQGVGTVRVLLTADSNGERQLAQNSELRYSGSTAAPEDYSRTSETVLLDLNDQEAPIVTRILYPTYRGALVVCQGGDRADVRLAVTEAVSVLTGLSSDRITVAKCP